jgi:peptidyl-tRNA hydrolase
MKQVIIVNDALNLPKGKLAAQVAHGAVAAFLIADRQAQQDWLQSGMPKIVLAAPTEQDLQDLLTRAEAASISAYLVHDAGRTVLAEGTVTCLGLGPATDEAIDAVTGDLKLL